MFGNPSIILTTPEGCRQVLMDEEKFGPGWPKSVAKIFGKRGLHGISIEEHRRQRRLTAASITGHEAMSIYLKYIKDIVLTSLKELSDIEERPIELLTEMRKIAFRIIMYIILGTESSPVLEAMEEKYTLLAQGVKAMSINLPGFAFHKALKVRFFSPLSWNQICFLILCLICCPISYIDTLYLVRILIVDKYIKIR